MTPAASRHRCRSPRGFSLLEVLVAVALVVALVSSMFVFAWNLLASRRRLLTETERHRAVTTLIERLERDLTACLAGDDLVGSGVAGDERSVQVLARSVPVRLAGGGTASNAALGDLERSTYRFRNGTGELAMSREVVSPGAAATGRVSSVVGRGLGRVRFRYHDGEAWGATFDSLAADALPRAIEVAVWYRAPADGGDDDDEAPEDAPLAADGAAPPPVRRTFDADAGFDEAAFADRSERDARGEPFPDRIRVILIPGGGPAVEEDATESVP